MWKQYLYATAMSAAMLAPIHTAQAQDADMMSTLRAAAIHECSTLAGRYSETTYASKEIYLYRSCMARHGQVE